MGRDGTSVRRRAGPRECGHVLVSFPRSHDAQHIDDREGDAQEHQQRRARVSDQDERQDEHRQETEPQPLEKLLVDYLEGFPVQVAATHTEREKEGIADEKGSVFDQNYLLLPTTAPCSTFDPVPSTHEHFYAYRIIGIPALPCMGARR